MTCGLEQDKKSLHMDWQVIFLLLLIGAISGFLAGLLGVGGGFVIVPSLFYLFQTKLPSDVIMHVVIATSLAVTAITTMGSTWGHYKKKAIDFAIFRRYLAGLLLGCICGALFASQMSGLFLKTFFGYMIIVMGVYFIFFHIPVRKHSWPSWTLNLFGFVIGNLSSLLGIGGGIFSVPLLLWHNLSIRQAVATSSTATLATVWIGTFTYLAIAPPLPSVPFVAGYISLPAFMTLSIAALLTVQWGVKATHKAPVVLIRRIFGGMLVLTGLCMLILRASPSGAGAFSS